MKKIKYESRSFTAPEELYKEFMEHCEKRGLNRSAIIRKLLINYLEEQKNKAL
ncbi:CopG family ribbon-helix-helix protein [Bacillus cihuensis]|uniref:CopG family ribbon-helix-helix protein n=1 Tax=Bacillus cihuensis TaxID=1208599 RepID=UPI0003FA6BC6|nr:ribbon-helix-helix protein, CopG family [Bacillus cihuensis]